MFRVRTGEAWLVARQPPEVEGGAAVQWADTVCSVGGYNRTSARAEAGVRCWNPLGGGDNMWVQVCICSMQYARIEGWLVWSILTLRLQVSQMGTRRYMPGSVVMDGKLFVAGGYDPETHEYQERHSVLCVTESSAGSSRVWRCWTT